MKTILPLLYLQLLRVNQSSFRSHFEHAKGFLQDPTLVYHDGSEHTNTIMKSLLSTQTAIIAEMPQTPSSSFVRTPNSAVLIASAPHPLVNILRSWKLWNARGRTLIILRSGSNVNEWLDSLWRFTRAMNVVIMILEEPPEFYTWFPYQKGECSDVKTITKINTSALFPPKIRTNLNSCPLLAVTSLIPPIVDDHFNGIEPRLFHDLATKLGMYPSYVKLPSDSYVWTTLNESQQPISGLKLLWENQVDILFSYLRMDYNVITYADFLPVHTVDESVFFVPGPKPLSRATAVYRAFSPLTWMLVLSSAALMYITFVVISFFNNNSSPSLLHTIAVNLSFPVNLPPSKIYQIFAVIAYLYSMHITTGYQASLIIFLSDVPREKSIQTLEDLENSGLPIEFHNAARDDVTSVSSTPRYSFLNKPGRVIFTPFLHLLYVAVPGNIALRGPKIAFTFYLRRGPMYHDEYGYPRVLVFSENDATWGMCFYVSKGHPLHSLLNKYTLYMIEAGLPGHYLSQQIKPSSPVIRQLQSFSMPNVEGAFILYIVLLGFSFTVFLIELVLHLLQKKKLL